MFKQKRGLLRSDLIVPNSYTKHVSGLGRINYFVNK